MFFKKPKGLQKPTDIKLEEYETWVQCHNLPLACMNAESLRKIGKVVGTVVEIDKGEGGNCLGQYGRIRMNRRIDKPVKKCVEVRGDEGRMSQTVISRYERLHEFHNACGRVGHNVRYCNDNTTNNEKLAFGPWLKAAKTMAFRRSSADGQGAMMLHAQERGSIGTQQGRARPSNNVTVAENEIEGDTGKGGQAGGEGRGGLEEN